MPKRIDESVAIELMRQARFEPLEPYKLIKSPWKSRCLVCGNICHPILNNVKSGQRGCRVCGNRERAIKLSSSKRMSKEAVDKILSDKSVVLLSPFESTKKEARFECLICNRQFNSKIQYIRQFSIYGCPDCRKNALKKPSRIAEKVLFDNVIEIMKEIGFETKVERAYNNDVIEIECASCGKQYKRKFQSLKKSGLSCACNRVHVQTEKGQKYIEEARIYALSRGGVLLSDKALRRKDKVRWKCASGHEWIQPIGTVLGNKSWCKDCAGQTPRTLEELQKVAESRGGKVLSESYSNVDATYDFECSLGHKFSNSFKHVVGRGQWCPRCSKGSKSEEICRTTFEQIFERKFEKARPKWLRNSRNRQMELDGFNEELGFAFEYQGIQHFTKDLFNSDLKQRIEDDVRKVNLCRENGIYLFILDYQMEYEAFPDAIYKQLLDFNLDVNGWNFDKEIDLSLAYIRNDRLEELVNLLKPKQIKVISNKWIAVDTLYDFECEVCGHIWSARGNHFFNSRRVGGCKKCAMERLGGFNRLNLEEIQEYAKAHNGTCLSIEYGHIKERYKFKCHKGHEFEDIFNNMKFRKTFCPVCEGRVTKKHLSDEEAHQFFLSHNLKPLEARPRLMSQGWRARCLVCGEVVNTSLQHLIQRKSPCRFCSGFEISEKKVRAVFESANLKPIVPFTSSSTPWKAICLICQREVNGRYGNLVKGQGGCRTCASRKRIKAR